MTKAERNLTANVDPALKNQAVTVCKIEKAMRDKVNNLIPLLDETPITQIVTSTQGEPVIKSNPAMAEIRATFRDYCAVVKVQTEMLGSKATAAQVSAVDSIREKLRIVK